MPIPQRMHSSVARSLTEAEGGNDSPLPSSLSHRKTDCLRGGETLATHSEQ